MQIVLIISVKIEQPTAVRSSNLMLNSEQRKSKTGDLGERLVARYFRQQGFQVEESLDLFDRKKDMIIDQNQSCEVKTQQLWHLQKAFTIRESQLKKCSNVDKLIFVETPSKYNQNRVFLYEFPKDKRQTRLMKTKDDRLMYLFPISNAILLETIDDPLICEQFNNYTLSTWS
jgi:hypothetical protein